ncbi:cell division protein FtsQ/DivIB [Tunturiibacter gelidoferens]|uniref:Cell division protein FtsQ n=1 Tax=Tunturiibacter gelidiferens TaxID=3069689 RepID=A0ACC5NYG0_9BACT|nr:cell division protein FtsQ [Edaphobacter lichenicola]
MLEAPEKNYVSESRGSRWPRRVSASPERRLRRDLSEDFADDPHWDDDAPVGRRKAGVRVRFRGVPATKWGRIAAGCGVVVLLGVCAGLFAMARSFLLHDERFVIPASSSIEFQGNAHVTRAQLLSVFGEDVERNIFTVSLAQRRAELERLPWVAHATVMRLLPNRMRVSIVERTPVAFVRQGNHIGLVDGNGVLLDMPVEAKPDGKYSFPVVTGISADDPLSTRSARMKIYERFTTELDGSGEKISQGLSEVDLSNPEDVKALIPDKSSEVLVHFGDADFLDRYKRFEEHLPEWRTVYPKLSSVDMRYERQVVLEMQPGAGVPVASSPNGAAVMAADSKAAAATPQDAGTAEAKQVTKPVAKVAAKPRLAVHPAPVKHAGVGERPGAKAPAKKVDPKAKKHVVVAKHRPVVGKPSAGSTQYHPPQAVQP